MWLILTILSACFWGVGQIFIKKGLQITSSLFNNIFSSVLGTLIFVPYALINGVNFAKVGEILPVTLIIAILFLIYYYTIGRGQLSLTGTVLGTYPLVTVILSFLFLHENPSVFQKLAIFIIILGTTCIALPNKFSEFKKVKNFSWLWWALTAIVVIGTADFLIKLEITQSDLYTYMFTYGILTTPVALLSSLFDKKGQKLPTFTFKKYLPTFLGVLLMELGFFTFHIALSQGYVSLITPISSIYVAITAVLAWFILKERINKRQLLGIILSILGVILIGIT